MPGRCAFSLLWLRKDEYKQWLVPSKDINKGKCKICAKDIEIATMGEAALKVHMKGKCYFKLYVTSLE